MKYHFPVILYDPECPLCVRFKQGLEYLNKDFCFVSARDEEIYKHFPELSRPECLEVVHLITEEKIILKGSQVIDHLINNLPGVSKLAWLLDNDQGKKVKDYFYQKVEELRELSQKKKSDCRECPRDSE